MIHCGSVLTTSSAERVTSWCEVETQRKLAGSPGPLPQSAPCLFSTVSLSPHPAQSPVASCLSFHRGLSDLKNSAGPASDTYSNSMSSLLGHLRWTLPAPRVPCRSPQHPTRGGRGRGSFPSFVWCYRFETQSQRHPLGHVWVLVTNRRKAE